MLIDFLQGTAERSTGLRIRRNSMHIPYVDVPGHTYFPYSRLNKKHAASPERSIPGRPHPRNRHRERYDFPALIRSCPELAGFVQPHPCGGDTIDFSDPAAIKALNRALLKTQYGLATWDIPAGYLCPPIPSRADYIHHVADLLSEGKVTAIPRGSAVRILDVGMGANCVYPIVGSADYGWHFVGTDIDPLSIDWARKLIAANPTLAGKVECRLQSCASQIFKGVVHAPERFDASMCNPPFHASAVEAAAGTLRKVRNLGTKPSSSVVLNFGGRSTELWCEGGESGFVRRMIEQSKERPRQILWFTTLVSRRSSLPAIYRSLHAAKPADVRTIGMAQGQKQSRIVAWTFHSPVEREEWRRKRSSGTGVRPDREPSGILRHKLFPRSEK